MNKKQFDIEWPTIDPYDKIQYPVIARAVWPKNPSTHSKYVSSAGCFLTVLFLRESAGLILSSPNEDSLNAVGTFSTSMVEVTDTKSWEIQPPGTRVTITT